MRRTKSWTATRQLRGCSRPHRASTLMLRKWVFGSPPRVPSRLITAAEAAATTAADKAKADAAAAAAAKAADTSISMPLVGQIYISEVMFAGGGTLPQWIEISNGSRSEQVNLSGWTLTVENATADADVSVGAKAVFTIPEGQPESIRVDSTLPRQRYSSLPNRDVTTLTMVRRVPVRFSTSGLPSRRN